VGEAVRSVDLWLQVASVVVVLAAWEIVARTLVDVVFFPPVSEIVQSLWQWVVSGEILPHLRVSLVELVLGFGLGFVAGLAIGILMGISRYTYAAVEPFVAALNATPLLALTPLFILALGIDLTSKVALIALITVIPIIINTAAGMRDVNREYLDVAGAFAASWWQTVYRVRLPASVPYVIAGARLALAGAIVGIFVAEYLGARQGIGFSISRASAAFDMPRMFAGVIILAFAGLLANAALTKLENHRAPWRSM